MKQLKQTYYAVMLKLWPYGGTEMHILLFFLPSGV